MKPSASKIFRGLIPLAPLKNEEVVQAQLESLLLDEEEIGRSENAGGLADLVAVVLFEGHAMDEAQGEEDFEDVIDEGGGGGEDQEAAGLEEFDAAGLEGGVFGGGEMFEDGEHGDGVEGFQGGLGLGENTPT